MDTATRLEIYELRARSAYALDERDLAMLETCLEPDAAMILDIAGGSGPIRFPITAVENGAIRLVTSGLYRDRVRCEAGRWVLAERRIDLDMAY